MRFISFGSGSSGNCYYLETDNDGILIDAGIGIRALKKYFFRYSIPTKKMRAILITHDHNDHIKAVAKISKHYDLPVYATKRVHDGIKIRLKHNNISTNKIFFIEPNNNIKIHNFNIIAFPIPHDSLENVGYEISVNGLNFTIMTDVGCITKDIIFYLQRANHLVLEANHDMDMIRNSSYPTHLKERILASTGHLSNEECAKALDTYSTDKLRSVFLCHLSEENNTYEKARETIHNVLQKKGKINLTVLERKIPTGFFDLE